MRIETSSSEVNNKVEKYFFQSKTLENECLIKLKLSQRVEYLVTANYYYQSCHEMKSLYHILLIFKIYMSYLCFFLTVCGTYSTGQHGSCYDVL